MPPAQGLQSSIQWRKCILPIHLFTADMLAVSALESGCMVPLKQKPALSWQVSSTLNPVQSLI